MNISAYRWGAQFYDRLWRNFTAKTLERVRLTLNLKRLNSQSQPICLLDLACGTGELERQLVRLHPEIKIIGLDDSHEMLSEAGRKLVGKPQITLVQGDAALPLPFANASFDAVVFANALHYVAQPDSLLQEVHRVLKPGGQLVIEDFTAQRSFLWPWFEKLVRLVDAQHYQTYTLSKLNQFVTTAGFVIIDSSDFKIDWWWRGMYVSATRLI